jgi:chemotaxis protein MotB
MRRARPAGAGATAGDEAPEYWVTYSDLLVSLLVVFALLLFTTLARMQRDRALAEASRVTVRQTVDRTDGVIRTAGDVMGARGGVRFDSTTRTLTVSDEMLFPFGRAELRAEGRRLVDAVATQFLPRLLADTGVDRHMEAIVVEGHTDTVGTYLSNLDLSQRRAQSVLRQIVEATDSLPGAERLRELLVASGRSKVEALRAAREGRYDSDKARRIVIRVRMRDDELLRQVLGEVGAARAAAARP